MLKEILKKDYFSIYFFNFNFIIDDVVWDIKQVPSVGSNYSIFIFIFLTSRSKYL